MATSTIQSTVADIIKTDIDDQRVVALMAFIEQYNTAPVKKVKAKKEKRETGPKRPASSYIRWLSDNRNTIKDEHFGEAYVLEHGELTGRDKTTAITKKAGELWNQLTDDAKAPWIEAYEKAKVEYITNNPSKVTASASVAFSFEDNELTECPEGYEGPYNQKYLWGYADGRKRGVGLFDNMEDAIKAADALGTKCGGITKQKSGFSLRMGGKLWSDLNTKRQTWVKKDCDADVKLTRKERNQLDGHAKAEVKAKAPKVSKPVKTVVSTPVEDTVSTENEGTEDDDEGVDPPDDDEDSDDEDSDDEELKVSEWMYKGVKYVVDETTETVYDPETENEIGTRVNGEFVPYPESKDE
jgi:hypothetical protein